MSQKTTETLPEKEIHAEVLSAVYVHLTDPDYAHIYFAGYDLQDAINNMNRWKYLERRDRHYEPVVVIDDPNPRVHSHPFS